VRARVSTDDWKEGEGREEGDAPTGRPAVQQRHALLADVPHALVAGKRRAARLHAELDGPAADLGDEDDLLNLRAAAPGRVSTTTSTATASSRGERSAGASATTHRELELPVDRHGPGEHPRLALAPPEARAALLRRPDMADARARRCVLAVRDADGRAPVVEVQVEVGEGEVGDARAGRRGEDELEGDGLGGVS